MPTESWKFNPPTCWVNLFISSSLSRSCFCAVVSSRSSWRANLALAHSTSPGLVRISSKCESVLGVGGSVSTEYEQSPLMQCQPRILLSTSSPHSGHLSGLVGESGEGVSETDSHLQSFFCHPQTGHGGGAPITYCGVSSRS